MTDDKGVAGRGGPLKMGAGPREELGQRPGAGKARADRAPGASRELALLMPGIQSRKTPLGSWPESWGGHS